MRRLWLRPRVVGTIVPDVVFAPWLAVHGLDLRLFDSRRLPATRLPPSPA